MENNELTYQDAFMQLQKIISEIERNDISVDLLEERIQRAIELIKICNEKLCKVEANVNNLLSQIGN